MTADIAHLFGWLMRLGYGPIQAEKWPRSDGFEVKA